MSGLAAFFGSRAAWDMVDRALRAMPDRGHATRQALDAPAALMAATILEWQELRNGGSAGQMNDVHVIADATLYYRGKLVRDLTSAGFPPRSSGAADLIAAAVAAWDVDAPAHLEGDFAYVAYRTDRHRGHAARDPVGTRPLSYASLGTTLAFASSPRALVDSGAASSTPNITYLAEMCAGTVNVGSETSFRDVHLLRQGERIEFGIETPPRISAWWEAPMFTEAGSSRASFAEAAAELRELLVDAVRERLDAHRPAFVSLSGGRDSTAVYAAATHVDRDAVKSVSLSYPPGDAGREDETILEVLAQRGGHAKWIDTATVPVLQPLLGGNAPRPDAFAHPYEATSRAIAETAAASGSHVVLNGLGGDTLFHAELTFLSDLVAQGKWGTFRSEWRKAGGVMDARLLFRWVVLPRLGLPSRKMIGALRGGRRVHDVFDQPLPEWIPFGRFGGLLAERAWSEPVRRVRGGNTADRERREMILGPFAGRIIPEYFRISLGEGIEQRSPLYDLRLIAFAASRPRAERRTGGDYKRLLRHAMEGWLPESVTGPRPKPTGFAGSYLRRALASELPELVRGFGSSLRTAELGLVIASRYRSEVDRFASSGAHPMLPALAFTAFVEHWLREK